jgi:S-layer homology domain
MPVASSEAAGADAPLAAHQGSVGSFAAAPTPSNHPRYWSASSPFNIPITGDPALDPRSTGMVGLLSDLVIADLYEYGIAIEYASSSTPKVKVTCWQNWGLCQPQAQSPLPIPSNTRPPPGTDQTTVIVDWANGRAIGLYQADRQASGAWEAAWGEVVSLAGSGISPQGGNAAGVAHLAGVVEVAELQAGVIDHALVFSTQYACKGQYRYPARKTDGESTIANCIPQGARVQLDPSVDVDRLNASKATKIVAKALQKYGAYAVDKGGAPMALYFEVADDAASVQSPGHVYEDLGWSEDYARLSGVPWDRLRVLAAWDSGSEPGPFSDVPLSHVFAGDIEWLADQGITSGCNASGTRFCPNRQVTRAEMAAFITRALHYNIRANNPFWDDDDTIFEPDIERIAAANVTSGCNPPANDRYCPDRPVTRAQMAAFIVRALDLTKALDDPFRDDDGSIFETDIERLAYAGITRGCNPPKNDRFCPNDYVTRAQMAAFLHRALT